MFEGSGGHPEPSNLPGCRRCCTPLPSEEWSLSEAVLLSGGVGSRPLLFLAHLPGQPFAVSLDHERNGPATRLHRRPNDSLSRLRRSRARLGCFHALRWTRRGRNALYRLRLLPFFLSLAAGAFEPAAERRHRLPRLA